MINRYGKAHFILIILRELYPHLICAALIIFGLESGLIAKIIISILG